METVPPGTGAFDPENRVIIVNGTLVATAPMAPLARGQGAYRIGELLQQWHGEGVRFLTTGVAGEKKVRTAILFGSHESTST